MRRTARASDEEVHAIIPKGYERATGILTTTRATLQHPAEHLLERQTLNADEVKRVVAGQPLPAAWPPAPAVQRARPRASEPSASVTTDFADLILDTGAPVGDAMIKIEGLDTPVSPGSTLGGCLVVNSIKAEVAQRLTDAGKPPKVLTAGALIGTERASEIFQAAYDEHGRRLSRYYATLGE